MSIHTPYPPTRNRWLDWKPKAHLLTGQLESEPTKPSEPGFEGFDGTTSGKRTKIETEPDPREVARASELLNRIGVRLKRIEGVLTISVRSGLDGPEVRGALHTLRMDRLPVRYLNGSRNPSGTG